MRKQIDIESDSTSPAIHLIYTVGNVLRYWSTGIGSSHESNMTVAGISLE